jgi:ABC-2 type transport system ATP-binding protein
MSGLDPLWRKMVKDFIMELKSNWTTVFFNTHVLADAEEMCDRISIIHKWNIIVDGEKMENIKWGLENYFIEKVTKADEKASEEIK